MNRPVELKASAVRKTFARRSVLSGNNLHLRSGECCLLSGPNGSGKTTLLRILAGLEKPDAGYFDLGDGQTTWNRCRSTLQTRILYLHQHPYMFDGTVRYNLAYALPRFATKSQRRERVEQALEWAGLAGRASTRAKTLSGGERQRVALTRAWLREPRVLLLDEPTANMDRNACARTVNLLAELKSRGMALLVAGHAIDHFESLINSHIHLDQGQLVAVDKRDWADGRGASPLQFERATT